MVQQQQVQPKNLNEQPRYQDQESVDQNNGFSQYGPAAGPSGQYTGKNRAFPEFSKKCASPPLGVGHWRHEGGWGWSRRALRGRGERWINGAAVPSKAEGVM
jgi:hypothetical protein